MQDNEINAWSSKAARSIIKMGDQLFDALEKGIQSKIKIVSHDCLVFLAWLGSEIAIMGSTNAKYSFESLLTEIAQFLHPGSDLEDRVLSCICVYNYTSGKGKNNNSHKIIILEESSSGNDNVLCSKMCTLVRDEYNAL